MAKKNKEDTVVPNEVPDTGLLNPKLPQPVEIPPAPTSPEIVIAEVDFNELLELEKATRQTEEQLNKLAGSAYRLQKDLELYHNHERTLNGQIDTKRKELIKRYRIDEQRQWRIDINNRKVVYQS